MDFSKLLKLCCPSNKESAIIKDEFYFNSNLSYRKNKERNHEVGIIIEDNSNFTFYTKNQNQNDVLDQSDTHSNSNVKNVNSMHIDNENTTENNLQIMNESYSKKKKNFINSTNSHLKDRIEMNEMLDKNNVDLSGKKKEKKSSFSNDENESELIKNSLYSSGKPILKIENHNSNKGDVLNDNSKKEDESLFNDNSLASIITEDDANKADKIILEVRKNIKKEIEGEILRNQKLIINAFGLINGARKSRDGIVFFGTKLKKNDIIINDFVLNLDEDNMTHTFFIYYKKETNKFYLKLYKEKETNNTALIIIKIIDKFIIKKKHIIKIGDCYFQVCPLKDQIEVVRLDSKNYDKKKYLFTNEDSPITIGRNNKCKISFPDDKSFSRIHSTIIYEGGNWVIFDGFENKFSTNGTWIYAQNSFEIQNETIFRINNSIIKIIKKQNINTDL